MTAAQLLEDRHRAQMRGFDEQRHDLLSEDAAQRVGPSARACALFL